MFSALGILGALMARNQTGKGQQVDATMVGSILAFLNAPATETLAHGRVPGPYTRPRQSQTYAFACADGAMLAIHLSSPQKFWEGLCKSVGHPELIEDPRFKSRPDRRSNYDDLNKTFAVFFKEQPRSHWVEQLEANDVPHTPVYNLKEVFDDPQVKHMGMQIAIERKDKPTIRTMKFPLTHSETPSPFPSPPPELGENNGEFQKGLATMRRRSPSLRRRGLFDCALADLRRT